MEKLNVILNGNIVKGIKGETILELAGRYDIEIPSLCHDDRLEPYSSCFVCVVEVDGMRGLQPSCSTKIVEGMKITTESDKIRKSRKSALELLLSNHYADCTAPCKQTCPAGVDVQGYIALMNKGMYREAVGLIKKTNPLPAICGRVCVRPCEVACRRNLLEGKGVGIDYLKRYATDMDFAAEEKFMPEVGPDTEKKVAVIGAGPGGLTAAYYLAIDGHSVEVFEASPHPGGMLRYGIPPYRLPNEIIDRETESIEQLGVKINYNSRFGENISYKDLKKNYDSVILAIGSQKGTSIGCDNDDAGNVFPGIDFLRNMEMTGQRYDFTGKKVAVIGGGNTAMDCCRTAMRCGAEKTYIIYRRTEKEMPANPIEIHESKLEGIEYMFLTAPARVNVDENHCLKTLSCYKMELGEPDASGRRRPMKVDGSEFEIELDYILAAIGQKTNVNFLNDINNNSDQKLIVNKWGDIDADRKTMQTSIKSVFACGDGVTGPATLIEAIAQGRKAARSCNLYLTGKPLTGEPFEFISKRDNFQKQVKDDYIGYYGEQTREEMPTLDPKERKNFIEVELGYNAQAAKEETHRCLECGCVEYYTCDLKKYSTMYEANQMKFGGDFRKHDVDFAHPFIEIDNNKCIVCSRCVRICKDIVCANALGLVNRGFETYVAPSMGQDLTETACESCGMCISTCPTAAISENFKFKPGPVDLDTFDTVCNYCSTGCEITIHHKKGFVMKVTGKHGLVNKDGNICRYPKFGYHYLNDSKHLKKPLLKVNGKFEEISFEKAYEVIAKKIKNTAADENSFFAGARMSNEELYLIQKFARAAVKTNNISSFHYAGRGDGYNSISKANVPFEQLDGAGRIYILGSKINYENAVVGYMINDARLKTGAKLEVITDDENDSMINKSDRALYVKSYYHFIKSVNHYILSNGYENRVFINDNVTGFDEYKKSLLYEDFYTLLKESGVFFEKRLIDFAADFNNEMNAVIVFSEKHLSANAASELYNLMLITGKLGKTSSGLIALKEKNNSQGLFDMGISPGLGVGGDKIRNADYLSRVEKLWEVKHLPDTVNNDLLALLREGKTKNLFVFGEDPVGCAKDKDEIKELISKAEFKVVLDYFMTETAEESDLILPASMPFESGGSYSNTQKYVIAFDKQTEPKTEKRTFIQLIELMGKMGIKNKFDLNHNITIEIATLLKDSSSAENGNGNTKKFYLEVTKTDNRNRMFESGCDYVTKRFDDYFEKSFTE
ncbi:MAG: FAD-dependent oxidoreductase [Ignavibacteriae bacterium]|nr:FAD-dependent oxidoreductase [Ignavibacteriota bacterium]